mmetsp:Transcript_59851/g.142584  ORF Transcript_59851/g.142584 Transcript_59851/m.142584 type:complete len:130 (+) Transcript_59851:54-443(+)
MPGAQTSWSTGCCSCTAEPGGCGLCMRACCCPCTVMGDIHAGADGCCGFCGGCVGTLIGCLPCMMCCDAPVVAKKAGFEESGLKACCCSCCPCYLAQVYRETRLLQLKGGAAEGTAAPSQQQMAAPAAR